jgi:prevent-host-death family protein
MKLSESIKPISYLKAHASEIVNDLSKNGKTMIITQNGEAKVVVQDIKEYEKNQETMSLLKILSLSQDSIKKGKFKLIDKAQVDLRKRMNKMKKDAVRS